MQEREITSRIRIDQLQPLLDTTSERVTAPMPAVTLEELLEPEQPPPLPVHVTFKRTPRGTVVPEYVDFEIEEKPAPGRENTLRMTSGAALGMINGIPVHACGPDVGSLVRLTREPATFEDVIEAAVDAAIDAEIHNAEIEAAIDAVTLPAPVAGRPRYMAVALGLAAAFVTGIGLMLAF
jgi:hypothetical protein